MPVASYTPTREQQAVIDHVGSAFIEACPGAGKTRTLVARAARLAADDKDRRGVAFLSFTQAAVAELKARLAVFGALPDPVFPGFIGTFDSFLWQSVVAPFGIDGCEALPRLTPDTDRIPIQPFEAAQALPLGCFDRNSGALRRDEAAREGFGTSRAAAAWETAARSTRARLRAAGRLDFDDARGIVADRLADPAFATRLGAALKGRFREIIVDEAQDCNAEDLKIIRWMKDCGLTISVVCDPNQAIYEFRGGLTSELAAFRQEFDAKDRLPMAGNFRSTPAICAAIVQLRPPGYRHLQDQPLGPHQGSNEPVHLLSYGGKGVPTTLGGVFATLIERLGVDSTNAPVVASTRSSAFKAIGQVAGKPTEHRALRLARAVSDVHFAFDLGDRVKALARLHAVVAEIQNRMVKGDYHGYLSDRGLQDGSWRPDIIALARALQPKAEDEPEAWLARAREQLQSGLTGDLSIAQRLPKPKVWDNALSSAPASASPAHTVHAVKGLEFPAVCVVMTSATARAILDHLEGQASADGEKEARRIYVGASRAQRLLAIATPAASVSRLETLLKAGGVSVVIHTV